MKLDINRIHEYQQNRYPFLMIDRAEEITPGERARGYKNFSMNDWFFRSHFPGNPSVPGVLQLEAIVQLSALMILTLPGNKGKVCYLVSADRLKWLRKVVPGDRFDIESSLVSWKRGIGRCKAQAFVENIKVCSAEFTIVLPDVVKEYQVNLKEGV